MRLALGESGGEVVFNTAMTGYQEVLTDPSYYGQIVTMTYPLIGNYGVNDEDIESARIQVAGFLIKEPSVISSNWRSKNSLEDWMKAQNIVGMCGVDTRALVRKLRSAGVMRGMILPAEGSQQDLMDKVGKVPSMIGADLVRYVTTDKPYRWGDVLHPYSRQMGATETRKEPYRVVVYDYGIKRNILRNLAERMEEVHVLPAHAPAAEVLALNPDGVFLSNGPGDPEAVDYAIENVRNLLGRVPIFGICLGHQIMSLALGAKTYKLKFGHRGANQPVKNMHSDRVEITSQNHGFCVDLEGIDQDTLQVTHINLNDNTVEGVESKDLKCFSVQYHPEAAPGPHDASHHFDHFLRLMKEKGK